MDAFRACVISHVYSDNKIGKEGVKALAQALERNSVLIRLPLDWSGADSAACMQSIILIALQKQLSVLRWKRH
jgi:kynurenine formamidase